MQNLTFLGVRLFALYVLVQALASLQSFQSTFIYRGNSNLDLILTILSFSSLSILSVVLFFRANQISKFITPSSSNLKLEMDSLQKLSAILFSTVGLFIIYSSFNMLLGSITQMMILIEFQEEQPITISSRVLAFLVGGVIQLFVGVFLFVRGKKVAKWWNKLKS